MGWTNHAIETVLNQIEFAPVVISLSAKSRSMAAMAASREWKGQI